MTEADVNVRAMRWRVSGIRFVTGGAGAARAGRLLSLGSSAAALVLGLSGCGSGGLRVSTGPSSRINATTSTPSAGTEPTWARGLGPGVTVVGPAQALPGHDSPGAAVQGFANALNLGKPDQLCSYYPPSFQAQCRSGLAAVPAGSAGTFKDFALGYVAIHGNEALVGTTGTRCQPNATPVCASNNDPARIFTTAKPFATLWTESLAGASSSSNTYSLAPCVRARTGWYLKGSAGGSSG